MNYLRILFTYFENVLHPASGWSDGNAVRRKKSAAKNQSLQDSPDCYNRRGGAAKKNDKMRRSPAP